MQIGVLGTGTVGQTLGSKLVDRGHEVVMGSRTANNEKAIAWTRTKGQRASAGTFADAARTGEMVFNCTNGAGSLAALRSAGAENLAGKILVDVSNPLDFSKGMPPSLFVSNTDSLAEQIQREFPKTKVVKALNTLNAFLMVDPRRVPGDHNVFLAGDDAQAKARVTDLLDNDFGWKRSNVVDVGGLEAARAMESLLPLWLRLWGRLQHPNFNFHIVVGPKPSA